MKKWILFMTVVLITATSANVFAQNTGALPQAGTVHEYWVNSTDGSAHDLGSPGNSYTWWVSTDPTDLTVVETEGTLFTVVSGPTYNSATVDSFKIGIVWNAAAVLDTLYVVVKEEDTDGNQCANLKAMAVVPQNDFKVEFVALEADGTTPGDSLSRCAPDIALTASGLDITYDYGVDTVMFQLSATDIYTDWSFVGTFANTLGVTPTLEYQVVSDGTWNTLTSGTPVNVLANVANSEQVLVRVSWDNGDTNGTFDEGTSDQVINLTLTNVVGTGAVPAEVVNSDDAPFTTSDTQLQTILARPATSTIGSN